jgi:hypothetical protein
VTLGGLGVAHLTVRADDGEGRVVKGRREPEAVACHPSLSPIRCTFALTAPKFSASSTTVKRPPGFEEPAAFRPESGVHGNGAEQHPHDLELGTRSGTILRPQCRTRGLGVDAADHRDMPAFDGPRGLH